MIAARSFAVFVLTTTVSSLLVKTGLLFWFDLLNMEHVGSSILMMIPFAAGLLMMTISWDIIIHTKNPGHPLYHIGIAYVCWWVMMFMFEPLWGEWYWLILILVPPLNVIAVVRRRNEKCLPCPDYKDCVERNHSECE